MIIESKKNNSYYLSSEKSQLLLLHPVLEHLLRLKQNGSDIRKWALEYTGEELQIGPKRMKPTRAEIDYYINFLEFLQKENFFAERKFIKLEDFRKYTADQVELSLANTEQISFEVTDACNLSCRYCGYGEYYTGYDSRNGRFQNFLSAKLLIDYVVGLKLKHINHIKTHTKIGVSFYGGEPLLHFDFIKKVVAYVNKIGSENFDFQFVITTNGTLLNKHLDFFVQNNFIITISLDGDRQNNVHRIFSGGKESFEIVYTTARQLQKKYPEFFKKNVIFNCVMHNKNSLPESLRFFKKHFDKVPFVISLANWEINQHKKKEFESELKKIMSEKEKRDLLKFEKKVTTAELPRLKSLEHFIESGCASVIHDIGVFVSDTKRIKCVGTGTCNPFAKKIFLTVNGKILPCERISQKYFLGQISGNKIDLDFAKIADRYNSYYRKMKTICNTCLSNTNCGQCIFHLDLDKEEVTCPGFQDKESYRKLNGNFISILEDHPDYYWTFLDRVNTGEVI